MISGDEKERLFEAALELPATERTAFIASACGDRPELAAELLSLLSSADAAADFFGRLGDELFASPADHGPQPGDRIRQYLVLERIGQGGMGVVFRAHDQRLDRDVALKFLPAPIAGLRGSSTERLLAEARSAAALEHPNVCTVYEIGEAEDGRPFIAMALYDGETLRERIRRGPLPPSEAVEVAAQVARGLGAAHARGIVHRDVKPENVAFAADGTVKLLDFGLAGLADPAAARSGSTLGTPSYMSPEQCRGEPVDARTDLWSLGIVLHEMLTGRRPYAGGSDAELVEAICREPAPPLTDAAGEATALVRVLDRLLRKNPDERYASAAELLDDLPPTPAAPRGASRRRTAAAGVLLVGALVAGGAWLLAGRSSAESTDPVSAPSGAPPSVAVLPLTSFSSDPADAVLADAMTEELITMLGRTGRLRVIASTSAFAVRGLHDDVRRVADSLGVDHVVEGTWQREGPRLRVGVRLVDGRDGSTRWTEMYDREFASLFTVQEEIARAVSRELDVRIATDGDPSSAARPRDIAAYEEYVRGSDQALLRSDAGVWEAVEHFQRAVALDSGYAPAWAGLSRLYLVHAYRDNRRLPRDRLLELSDDAARRAVTLDSGLPEAFSSRGLLRLYRDLDFTGAEADLQRAVLLDPTRALPRQWLAMLYLQTGRPAEALREAERAVANDPVSPSAHAEVAHALIADGRYDEALERLERIRSVEPPLLRTAFYDALACAGKGMWTEALEAAAQTRNSSTGLALYGLLLGRAGREAEARAVLQELLDRQGGSITPYEIAIVYEGLGDYDQAFTWFERSIADRSILTSHLGLMEPIFSELRRDPRFGDLVRGMGRPELAPAQNL